MGCPYPTLLTPSPAFSNGIRGGRATRTAGALSPLLGLQIDVETTGRDFLPSYVSGDNQNLVATNTIKNFVLTRALVLDEETIECFLHALGTDLLAQYPQMEMLRLTGREEPFEPIWAAGSLDASSGTSGLFSKSTGDRSTAMLQWTRTGKNLAIRDHYCTRVDLDLIKLSGSAFTGFVRDEFTTLEEAEDRLMVVGMSVFWKYLSIENILSDDAERYVASTDIRDYVYHIFGQLVSRSIQHLVHEICSTLLNHYPQLAEVWIEAENKTWARFCSSSDDPRLAVYTAPFPAYGIIRVRMSRNECHQWT